MRLSVIALGLVCFCAVVIGIAAPLQDEDDVRGAFLTSRPKEKPATSGAAKKPGRRRPPKQTPGATHAVNKPADKKPAQSSTSGTPVTPVTPSTPSTATKPVNAPRIGLGLTLFMRDSNGSAVRVDPDHVFHKGDRVRVLLETNTDGYLYIFNRTNDGPAVMIYPNADLDEAGNYVQAHVPFEIPTSQSAEERLRWFAFDEIAGTERLFFVFTREPLSGIPIEDDLIALCRDSKESCPVKPSTEVWAGLEKEMQAPLKTDKTQQIGGAQTTTEQQATTRGLGLAKTDPEPSLVMMASSARPTLVATLDLIHK
ncbi:MAG TPA: DUF4384 domain-containing protein [Pyrinomonadaceae bacterium]|nr:DUF4384 domain-containing protein [Pyrinomonadaceae bacterium]